MNNVTKNIKSKRWWIMSSIIFFIIFASIIVIAGRGKLFSPAVVHKGEFLKMKLPAYQSVAGVLNIQHWNTKNGVPVYFVQVPTLPMVDIEIVFDAGAARNGEKGALAYLTNALLSEGTQTLSADQIAESFESVGAEYHAASVRDMATINLRSLSEPKLLTPAVDTLTAIVSAPNFPESAFVRERQNVLTSLKKQAQTPSQVANRAFYSAIYANHPYSNWVLGNEASVQALTLDDIKAFYKQYYVANNAVVAIVGNLSAHEANAIAEKVTEKLPRGEKPAALPAVMPLSKQEDQSIPFSSEQTHILMGQPLIQYGDPDYYALYVGNHILGGNGSVTRIFNTVRKEHGLAYSAYSYFQQMREQGPYILGCQTRTDQAEKALGLLKEVLKEYVEKGPTEKELEDAKRNILGGYALQFDSNASIEQQIAAMGFYGLPLDYFDKFKKEVEKLTVDDIKKTFQKRVIPEKMAIIMVGKSEKKD